MGGLEFRGNGGTRNEMVRNVMWLGTENVSGMVANTGKLGC